MNIHTFSKNSIHYRLANFPEKNIWDSDQVDICTYTKLVLRGAASFLGLTLLILTILTTFMFGLWDTMAWGWQCYELGHFIEPGKAATVFMAIVSAVLIIIIYAACRMYMEELSTNYTPTFVTAVKQKIKSKTCFLINFK